MRKNNWPPQLERFWARVDRRGDDECWPWLGALPSGRGSIRWNGRQQYAYRVSWEIANGAPVPADMHACHQCDNPACVNPAHIFIGTGLDNLRDAARKSRLSKYPPEVVRAVVDDYLGGGGTQHQVAARHGVTRAALADWIRAKSRTLDALTDRLAQDRDAASLAHRDHLTDELSRSEP